jgi:hypothetical protein
MSWGISRSGKATAVAAAVEKDLAGLNLSEPELSVKNAIGNAIAQALAAFPSSMPVNVDASGSQTTPDSAHPEEKVNQARLSIEPLWGFLE